MFALVHGSPVLKMIYGAWVLWGLSWLAAAPFAARARKRSPWTLLPAVIIVAAMILLPRRLGAAPLMPLWHISIAAQWVLLAAVLAGFAFTWWARLTLGRLWSGTITLKDDHHIVDTGPYGIVRHPIYTGLLLAAFATAAAQGSAEAVVIAGALTVMLFVKALAEERFLSRELGVDAYAAYRRRVPMLVPFAPW